MYVYIVYRITLEDIMNKYLIKLLDRNQNKKVDWHEILFPTPDINKNKRIDWWEALIGVIFFIGFWGTIIGFILLSYWLINLIK